MRPPRRSIDEDVDDVTVRSGELLPLAKERKSPDDGALPELVDADADAERLGVRDRCMEVALRLDAQRPDPVG